jgi:pimeloyl-ACP methyl ester carboxylesterase
MSLLKQFCAGFRLLGGGAVVWACLLALGHSKTLQAQDYAREQRWAEEITPSLVVGEPVQIMATSGKPFLGLFAKAERPGKAILLLHSVGTHPDFGVIGQLRSHLFDLGYTTLSIQLPVQAREAKLEDYYPKVFGDAKDRIGRSLQWLKAAGFDKPVLVSHTMGSWMANEYLDEHHAKGEVSAWVCMSLTGGYSWTARAYGFPILDVYAENDIAPTMKSNGRRKLALLQSGSRQFMVPGAEAEFGTKERLLAEEIRRFLGN